MIRPSDRVFLVRYGRFGQIGRFVGDHTDYARGDQVVVESPRGIELGEILALERSVVSSGSPGKVLRAAQPSDLHRALVAAARSEGCLDRCEQVLQERRLPVALLEFEPLLEDSRGVLHFLGVIPNDHDGLLNDLRTACGVDIVLSPCVAAPEPIESDADCGSCASGGCGSCASEGEREHCAGCGLKDLLASR